MKNDEISDIDFTAEDRGGFSHPTTVGDLSYAELEAKVLDALTDDEDDRASRTLGQIKRAIGVSPGFDLSPVIEGMQVDKKIFKHESGEFAAFYVAGAKVVRSWLDNGKIRTVYRSASERPTLVTAESPAAATTKLAGGIDPERLYELAAQKINTLDIARKIGLGSVHGLNLWLNEHPSVRQEFDRIRLEMGANSEKKWADTREAELREKARHEQERSDGEAKPAEAEPVHNDAEPVSVLTPEKVFELASTLSSGDKIAKQAGFLTKAAFYRALNDDESLKDAFQRGRQEWIGSDTHQKRSKPRLEIDAEKLEQLAGELSTQAEICEALGISASLLALRMKDQAGVREAYDRGRERYFSQNPNHTGRRRAKGERTDPIELGVPRRSTKTVPTIELTDVENLAARGLTQVEAAEELGVTVYVFKNRLNSGPRKQEYRDAWKRGQEKAKEAGLVTGKALGLQKQRSRATVAAVASGTDIPDEAETVIESFIESFIEAIQTAVDAGHITPQAIHDLKPMNPADICTECLKNLPEAIADRVPLFPNPDSDDCWLFCSNDCLISFKEKHEIESASDNETVHRSPDPEQFIPAFEGSIETFGAKESPFTEKAGEEFPPVFYAEPNEIGSRTIELENCGQIDIRISGNFFQMTERERLFVQTIVTTTEEFTEGKNIGYARSVDRKPSLRQRFVERILGK